MSILKSYNIGVIGAGWIAKAHMGFLRETGRANITWIYGTRGGIKLAYCTWDDPEIIYYDLDEEGKTRETRYMEECPKEEDGYFLIRHLIDVLDGKVQPAVSLENAKKHMSIIFSINEINGSN